MGDKRHLWTDAFLAALAETGILSRASEIVGVDRILVWRRRQTDPEFAKAEILKST